MRRTKTLLVMPATGLESEGNVHLPMELLILASVIEELQML